MSDAEESGNGDKAIELAKEEIQVAQENEIEYWATDGLNRLGTAYFSKEDFADAERSHLQALKQSKKNGHPKLEANANFGLASIRDQQGRWDESIPLARAALQYYESFAFMSLAAGASELIIRGEEGKGDTTQALQSANESLQLARRWNDPAWIEIAEESVGRILLGLEKFPDALTHFEEALKAGRSINQNVAYQQFHCADALWRLGRYEEAEDMLRSIPADAVSRSDVASAIAIARAEILLSKRRFREALNTSEQALEKFPDLAPQNRAELARVEALAESERGQAKKAQSKAQELDVLAREQSNEELIASANLVQAMVHLNSRLPDQARAEAEAANQYFHAKGKEESEWLSLYCIALAYKDSGDTGSSSMNAKKALALLAALEHTWGPPTYRLYLTRPDNQEAFQTMKRLSKS